MNRIVILKPADVVRIIAKHFNVDEKKVHLRRFMETKGYGLGEHKEPTFQIEVEEDG